MKTYREAISSAAYRMRGHLPESIRILSDALDALETDPLPDQYGTGSVIENFQARISNDLGKEQSVFFPSGTMAQQIALRIWCDEMQLMRLAYHPLCHLEIHEQDGLKELHHIETVLLGEADRLFTMADLKTVGNVACVLFELPQREIGGQLPAWDDLVEMVSYCASRGFHTHLDGARLLECLPFYEKTAAEVCALFDSVYLSFYKSLGGVTGAMLSGTAAFMEKAKIWKRRHGGDLYHLYPYVLTAGYAYDLRKDNMSGYWSHAKAYCRQLNRIKGFRTVPDVPVCNMFHLHMEHSLEKVEAALVNVMETHDVSLLGGLSVRDGKTVSEIWMGDSCMLVPEELLDTALEMLARELKCVSGDVDAGVGMGQAGIMNIQLRNRTAEHVRIFWNKTRDPDIQRLFPFSTSSLEEAQRLYALSCAPDATSYGRIICLDDNYVGDIWCYGIDETDEKMAMMSIVLFEKSIWGKGVGTISGTMFLQEIFQKYGIEKVGAFTFSENSASINLLRKLGFVEIEEFVEDNVSSKYFERMAESSSL